jgi:hypothetical protein
MTTIEESRRNIYKYNDIINKLSVIIGNLEKYIEVNNKTLAKISQEYSVNDENPAIYKRIKLLSEDANKTSNYLKDTIIPAIRYAIRKEKNNISDLEAAGAE